MRRTSVALALLAALVLSGCGTDTAEDTPVRTSPTDGSPGTRVVLLHDTAVGGTVGDLTPVMTEERLSALLAQLTSDTFVAEVRRAVEQARSSAGEGEVVEAGVVTVGCEVPDMVTLRQDGSIRVDLPTAQPERQCLAPMTTVAVAIVPA